MEFPTTVTADGQYNVPGKESCVDVFSQRARWGGGSKNLVLLPLIWGLCTLSKQGQGQVRAGAVPGGAV